MDTSWATVPINKQCDEQCETEMDDEAQAVADADWNEFALASWEDRDFRALMRDDRGDFETDRVNRHMEEHSARVGGIARYGRFFSVPIIVEPMIGKRMTEQPTRPEFVGAWLRELQHDVQDRCGLSVHLSSRLFGYRSLLHMPRGTWLRTHKAMDRGEGDAEFVALPVIAARQLPEWAPELYVLVGRLDRTDRDHALPARWHDSAAGVSRALTDLLAMQYLTGPEIIRRHVPRIEVGEPGWLHQRLSEYVIRYVQALMDDWTSLGELCHRVEVVDADFMQLHLGTFDAVEGDDPMVVDLRITRLGHATIGRIIELVRMRSRSLGTSRVLS